MADRDTTGLQYVMRRATQAARLNRMDPVIGFVGASLHWWRQHDLVSREEEAAFKEACIEAGRRWSTTVFKRTQDPKGKTPPAGAYGRSKRRRTRKAAKAGEEEGAQGCT